MKKLLSLILGLLMVLVIAGCGKPDVFAGSYKPVTEAQLTEIKTNLDSWLDEKWDTYAGDAKVTTEIGGYKTTQKGSIYMHTVPGHEIMSLNVSASFSGSVFRTEMYVKDGAKYNKSSGGGEQTAYSCPADPAELYGQMKTHFEGLGIEFGDDQWQMMAETDDFFLNLKRVLKAVDINNMNINEVTATAASGEMKIKAVFKDIEFYMGIGGDFGFSFDIKQNLELYLKIDENNSLTDVRIILNREMFIGGIVIAGSFELTLKPYSGNITLPNDLNTTNYPSIFD